MDKIVSSVLIYGWPFTLCIKLRKFNKMISLLFCDCRIYNIFSWKCFFEKEIILKCYVVFLKMLLKTFFFFHIFSFSKLICNKKKKRLKNNNWGSVVGVADSGGWVVVVRLISFGWNRKWKRKSISIINVFILRSIGKQFLIDLSLLQISILKGKCRRMSLRH